MHDDGPSLLSLNRRRMLGGLAAFAAATPSLAHAADTVSLSLPGGPDQRQITTAFPEKGRMILQRTRPPLLETPFEVFDKGVFTPNDLFFVRWHWAVIPTGVDVDSFRLTVRGQVNETLALTLADLLAMPRFEIAAINQCSGNSRGFFQPRVAGGEWANGAMGNAKWTGVRLRDVLDRAGVKAGATGVRFDGLDQPVVPSAPKFMKSLDIDHARDGEVMIAYQMNGAQLPLLNGFPIRLIVPGWYSTYWVKMLNDIEVLDAPDDNYWMASAYRIPDTPGGNVKPDQTGFKTVPINRMVPRSFVTNHTSGDRVPHGQPVLLRGIAFGGDTGVKSVDVSDDGGHNWRPAELGHDEGKYSFRRWTAHVTPPRLGTLTVMVRCTNTNGLVQPAEPVWNNAGFMQNVIQSTQLRVA
jgi:DMSO/TMAO reductase YedYZ molybdopterin-dependent catalytic subunit